MFGFFKSRPPKTDPSADPLHFDRLIQLDAEALAENGIECAYQDMREVLCKHVPTPAPLTESREGESYSVEVNGINYPIDGPGLDDNSWGRATFALFDSINKQLTGAPVRFYALNGGNDLFGVFLTEAEYQQAIKTLPQKRDWPYIVTNTPPDFGFPE